MATWRPARPLRDDLDPAALSCRELLAGVFDQHSLLAFDAAADSSLLVGLARRLTAMLGLLAPSRAIPAQHLDYDRRIPFR